MRDYEELKRGLLAEYAERPCAFFKASGRWQSIARSSRLRSLCIALIPTFLVWISIDTDYKNAFSLVQSAAILQCVTCFFFVAFLADLIFRFLAFRKKVEVMKDKWMIFDFVWSRVSNMCVAVQLIRWGRILQENPEYVVIYPGLLDTTRALFCLCVLELIMAYVFSITLQKMAAGTVQVSQYFASTPHTLHTLLFHGLLLKDLGSLLDTLGQEAIVLEAVLLAVAAFSFTVVVICGGMTFQVVGEVATEESRWLLLADIRSKIHQEFSNADSDGDGRVDLREFVGLCQEPAVHNALFKIGIDVGGVLDMAEEIFASFCADTITFHDFLEAILTRSDGGCMAAESSHLRGYSVAHCEQSFSKFSTDAHRCQFAPVRLSEQAEDIAQKPETEPDIECGLASPRAWQHDHRIALDDNLEAQALSTESPPSECSDSADSLCSAPAVMMTHPVSDSDSDEDAEQALESCENDCLPAASLVWVEGQALPKEVSSISPGDRVLCFDGVSKNMKYNEVLCVQESHGATEWAEVTLGDGTQLTSTADHPIYLAAPSGHDRRYGSQLPVQARDLKPGKDQILALRVLPVTVENVEIRIDSSARVALSINQPSRFTVFVSEPGQKDKVQALAVGSADHAPDAKKKEVVTTKNTFLNINLQDSSQRAYRRPRSSPPDFADHQAYMVAGLEEATSTCLDMASNSSYSYQSSLCSSRSSLHSEVVLAPASLSSPSGFGEINASSPKESWQLDGSLQPQWTATTKGTATLSSLIRLQSLGFSSAGSQWHSFGECSPCVHENKFQYAIRNQPCKHGKFCNFCHDAHHNILSMKHQARNQHRKIMRQVRWQSQSIWNGTGPKQAAHVHEASTVAIPGHLGRRRHGPMDRP